MGHLAIYWDHPDVPLGHPDIQLHEKSVLRCLAFFSSILSQLKYVANVRGVVKNILTIHYIRHTVAASGRKLKSSWPSLQQDSGLRSGHRVFLTT